MWANLGRIVKNICKYESDVLYLWKQNNRDMNRVIKFRGLRTDGKGWVYGWYRQWFNSSNGKTIHIISDDYSNTTEVITETVGQFTGLTDKNGKKIYEGDILNSSSYHRKWIVDFTHGDGLKLSIKYDDDIEINGIMQTHENWSYNKVKSSEVTGNIHQQ